MAELGIKPGIPPQARDPRMTTLHAGAVAIAFLSGTLALVALAVGSPLQFGVALASCAAGWIAADFVESTAERQRAARRCAVPATRLNPGYESGRVVYVGRPEHFSRPSPRAETVLAA